MNKTTQRVLVTLGFGGAIVAGGFFYFWQKQSRKSDHGPEIEMKKVDVQEIPDSVLIAFLRDLRSQSFPHFFLVADITTKMKIDFKDETFQQVLQSKVLPEIQKLFESKQNLVCVKYQYPVEVLQKSIQLSQNETVIKLLKNYENLYIDSTNGIQPEINLNQQTIDNFTHQKLLNMLNEILIKSTTIILDICINLRDQNGSNYQISLQKPDFQKLLFEKHFIEEKQQVMINYKLTQFEPQLDELGLDTSEIEVYQKLLHLKKQEDKDFNQFITNLENKYDTLINKFLTAPISKEEGQILISELEKTITAQIDEYK